MVPSREGTFSKRQSCRSGEQIGGRGGAGREVGVEGKGTRGTSVALELLGISGGGSSGLHRLKRKGIPHSHSHTQSRRRAGNPCTITDGASTSRCDVVLAVQAFPRGTLGSGCGSHGSVFIYTRSVKIPARWSFSGEALVLRCSPYYTRNRKSRLSCQLSIGASLPKAQTEWPHPGCPAQRSVRTTLTPRKAFYRHFPAMTGRSQGSGGDCPHGTGRLTWL